jgi:hypothetical protein
MRMSASQDPVADVIACLLAIIEGLCRVLAEQAAREAETGLWAGLGANLRAKCAAKLTQRLRRMAEDVAAAAKTRQRALASPGKAPPPLRQLPPPRRVPSAPPETRLTPKRPPRWPTARFFAAPG